MFVRRLSACVVALTVLAITGCRHCEPSARHQPPSGPAPNTIAQVATIDALLAGGYDGYTPCSEIAKYGDFGIGTFDKLDGEMIVLDGVVYQVKSDGRIYQPDGALTTPFVAVNQFVTDHTMELGPTASMAAMTAQIDAAVPNPNVLLAVKIHGTFSHVKCRSVPAQAPPYRKLADVVPEQSVFEYGNITGTLVGYRLPTFTKGVNVPGYHLHFLSDDHTRGGHILELAIASAHADLDICQNLLLMLPDSDALQNLDLSRDRSAELEKVEK